VFNLQGAGHGKVGFDYLKKTIQHQRFFSIQVNIQGTFSEHSGNVQVTFSELAGPCT
jgi:hypothetical protein